MKPGGVIAFHVTNRYLDLIPVVQALAERAGDVGDADPRRHQGRNDEHQRLGAAVRRPGLAREAGTRRCMRAEITPRPDWRLWTDDFNNLMQVLK